jgi:hypothetical protein
MVMMDAFMAGDGSIEFPTSAPHAGLSKSSATSSAVSKPSLSRRQDRSSPRDKRK